MAFAVGQQVFFPFRNQFGIIVRLEWVNPVYGQRYQVRFGNEKNPVPVYERAMQITSPPRLEELARSSDPATSQAAAQSVTNITEREELVIKTLKQRGPMTQEEMADTTGVERPAISPRFAPLLRKGLLQIIGTRKNRSGRSAQVFSLTDRGRLAF